MPLTPLIRDARLHSVLDPNGGMLYADAAATVPVAVGQAVLTAKDAFTTNLGRAVGKLPLTLAKTETGARVLRTPTPPDIRYAKPGGALRYDTGPVDPADFTLLVTMRPYRRCKMVDELVCDIGNSPGGKGAGVLQIVHTGMLKPYDGSRFASATVPYIAADSQFSTLVVRSNRTGVWLRRTSDIAPVPTTRAPLVPNPSAVGWTLLGRSANDLFGWADALTAVLYSPGLSDAEELRMQVQLERYAASLGHPSVPTGKLHILVTDGDSNSVGIACSQTSKEWSSLLREGLLERRLNTCLLVSLGCSNRTVDHCATYRTATAARLNAAQRAGAYFLHVGENDLFLHYTPPVFLAKLQNHLAWLRVAAPRATLFWCTPPPRRDGGPSYEPKRAELFRLIDLDPTLGGVLDGIVDSGRDPVLGDPAQTLLKNVYGPDGIHFNDAGNARLASLALPLASVAFGIRTALGERF